MKNPFSFETLTEQGKNLTKSVQSQVKSQLGGTTGQSSQIPPNADAALAAGLGQDQSSQDFVNELYGATNQQGAQGALNPQQQVSTDQQMLEATRKKLHQQRHDEYYFQPTFNAKPQEESTGDRLEREDQEKKMEDAKKMELEQKKKEVPKAPGKGSERSPGASG